METAKVILGSPQYGSKGKVGHGLPENGDLREQLEWQHKVQKN